MPRPLLFSIGLLAVAVVVGAASAVGPARKPGASAQAWAIRVVVPSGANGATATVVSPPASGPAFTNSFAYPADGSILTTGATTASATTSITDTASAKASSDASGISIFGGEITVDAVAARAQADAGLAGATGDFDGTGVVNFQALGQAATSGRVALGDWGYATIGAQGSDTTAPAGAQGYRGFVTTLDIHLNIDHGGLAAGSEIQIGYAEAAAQTPPPPPATTTTTTTVAPPPSDQPPSGDRPQLRPKQKKPSSLFRSPLKVQPELTAGRYVFPVYGPSSYVDTYGAGRADVSYHHGDDIFGQLGQPLLAVADGTVFSVGWNKVGGNRLWLRDKQGNEFYYAHLSAFSTLAVNGAHVKAGQVIGFMGNTGDAEATPYHLHFEVHPVSLLYLGYDGAVDPTPYLDAWKRLDDLPFPVAAAWPGAVGGTSSGPPPGAYLLGMSDISSADGLDPASLERALTAPATPTLSRTLVPPPVPNRDLGRG